MHLDECQIAKARADTESLVPTCRLVGSDHRALSQILGGLRTNRNFVAEDRRCEIARPLQACLVCAWLNVGSRLDAQLLL